ncbi:hypothetical protein FPE01S_01_11710 [Flavihumibacter petaseus NBRC 106054]|uniref:Uncharacterized protein n=1 Tax=Flavihumibacter petaseus NBRC 106054 TaxID=1220578 RepID=A0A0E9MXC6_9BACT|nr:hypothetical protein FPE01S_01_11710 [Flavihumibacter petaseus NBRC 106054]
MERCLKTARFMGHPSLQLNIVTSWKFLEKKEKVLSFKSDIPISDEFDPTLSLLASEIALVGFSESGQSRDYFDAVDVTLNSPKGEHSWEYSMDTLRFFVWRYNFTQTLLAKLDSCNYEAIGKFIDFDPVMQYDIDKMITGLRTREAEFKGKGKNFRLVGFYQEKVSKAMILRWFFYLKDSSTPSFLMVEMHSDSPNSIVKIGFVDAADIFNPA